MFDKPLFSQRQLKIIMVVTAVAIVLLSATGQRPSLPEIESRQLGSAPLYWMDDNSEESLVSFSFTLPGNRSGNGLSLRLAQQFLLQDLEAAFQDSTTQPLGVNVKAHHNRLQIQLKLDNDEPLDPIVTQLLEALNTPVSSKRWSEAKQKQQAQIYLDHQSEKPGWYQLRSWMHPQQATDNPDYSQWLEFQRNLFSRHQLRIALTSSESEALMKPLQIFVERLPEGKSWPDYPEAMLSPQHQQLTTLDGHQLLLGRHSLGRSQSGFAAQMLAVRTIQQSARELGIYSQWQPSGQHSELILYASSTSLLTPQRLLQAIDKSLKNLDEKALEDAQEKMLDQFYQRLESPQTRHEQLEAIAFYQLPLNYQQQFVDELEQLSPSQLSTQIGDLLDGQQYHWIQFVPAS
ncbi:MAG: hypothetical protein OQK12_00705 [Motiliproteus sp.]|nr:hypothetical protein [Motiliproteus sp.]MCW9054214.1 hypothetical protein [Motiliproteus sp.]